MASGHIYMQHVQNNLQNESRCHCTHWVAGKLVKIYVNSVCKAFVNNRNDEDMEAISCLTI